MEKLLGTHEFALPQGPIKGAKRESVYGVPYFSFEGIPYAKPPLGELRFMSPQPAEPWTETLDCTKCGNKPTQILGLSGQTQGSEDCLSINVYTKTLQSAKPLPVLVFIFGGGFNMGEASRERYGPDYFMNEDVILITFNYRLNALGFLSFKDPELKVPGNAGLKDQVMALKWIKKYIPHFNGDPENITLFGESAGAAATHYMALTDQTRGLFQRAVLMSGCALNSWTNQPPKDMAFRLAKKNGYTGENNEKDLFKFLFELKAEKFCDMTLLTEEEEQNGAWFAFVPVVEPYITEDCVVPKEPFEMQKTAWSNSIPMIIGANSLEGACQFPILKMYPQRMTSYQNNLEALLPEEIRKCHSKAESKELGIQIKKIHFGDKKLDAKAIMEFVDYYSYKAIWHAVQRAVLQRLEYAPNAPTYLYRFAFDSPEFNLYRKIFCGRENIRGAAHSDDLSYIFYFKESWKLSTDSLEYKTIERMVSWLTAFAKNGDPNCDKIKPAEWKPLKQTDPYQALNIANDLKMRALPEKRKLQVWNSMYKKEELY